MQAIQIAEARELNQKRRFVYNTTFCVVAFLLFLGMIGIPQASRGPILEWVDKNRRLFIYFPVALAHLAADWICRLMGLSLAGKMQRSVRRQKSSELYPLEETAVIQPDFVRSVLPILLLALIMVCADRVNFLAIRDIPLHPDWGGIALIGVTFCVLCAAPFAFLNRKKPILQVDENGIAYCGFWGVRSGFIAWQDIEACEIEVVRNNSGTLVSQTFRFKDSNGKQLVALAYPYVFLTRTPENVANSQRMDYCWSLIQKRLTGEFDASLFPPLELAPRDPGVVAAPIIPPPRIIERDNQLPDELRRIEKPLVIPAGSNRYFIAVVCSLMPIFIFLVLRDINPLSPASRIPANYDHTFFESWPIWLIMSIAAFSFVCLLAFLIPAPFFWLSTAKPDLLIDNEGITYRGNGQLKSKALKWDQIAVCEIRHNRFLGGILTTNIFLKDVNGKELLKMKIDFNSEAANWKDTQRVTEVIEQYLTGHVLAR